MHSSVKCDFETCVCVCDLGQHRFSFLKLGQFGVIVSSDRWVSSSSAKYQLDWILTSDVLEFDGARLQFTRVKLMQEAGKFSASQRTNIYIRAQFGWSCICIWTANCPMRLTVHDCDIGLVEKNQHSRRESTDVRMPNIASWNVVSSGTRLKALSGRRLRGATYYDRQARTAIDNRDLPT